MTYTLYLCGEFMNGTLWKAVCILMILEILMLEGVSAQEESFKPGVSVGDSFAYRFYVSWEASEPLTAPANIVEINNTETVRMVVHEAFYAIVILNVTTHYKNGTVRQSQLYVNLLNGEGDGFGFIIAPNLSPNRTAYHMGFEKGKTFLIKNETVKKYPFGERKVLTATVETYGSDEYIKIQHEMIFDKVTGIMLEWRTIQTPKYSPTAKVTLNWQIAEFKVKAQENTQQNQENPNTTLYLLIPAAAIAAITVAVVYKKKKKQKHP